MITSPEIWILSCEAVKQDDTTSQQYQIKVAVLTNNPRQLNTLVSQALRPAGYLFLLASPPQPINQYLTQAGAYDQEAISLSQQLSDEQPVAYSLMGLVGESTTPQPDYLHIKEHRIPALPNEEHLAFWKQQWVAPELKPLLFAQPDTTPTAAAEPSPVLHTYLLLDASTYIKAYGIFNLHHESSIPVRCMFKGAAFENNKTAAPYLIDLSLTTEQYHSNDIPHFHQRLFNPLWQHRSGLFIRSTHSFEAIYNHLRHFIQLPDQQGNLVFFRYWDPRVALAYFQGIQHCQARVAKWLGVQKDTQLIQRYYYQGQSPEHCIEVSSIEANSIEVNNTEINSIEANRTETNSIEANSTETNSTEANSSKVKNINTKTAASKPPHIALFADKGLEKEVFVQYERQKFIAHILPSLTAKHTLAGSLTHEDMPEQLLAQIEHLKQHGFQAQNAVLTLLGAYYETGQSAEHWDEKIITFIAQAELSQAMKAEHIYQHLIQHTKTS